MHLLATPVATIEETAGAVDLAQSPADLVALSFSDSDLSALASAWTEREGSLPPLRLASLKRLMHPMSVDLYVDTVARHAKAILVRALGGLDYWRYGFERLAEVSRLNGIRLAALPGDDRPDPRLAALSTVPARTLASLDALMRAGGTANARRALELLADARCDFEVPAEPETIGPAVGLLPSGETTDLGALSALAGDSPLALVVFYRASLLAADTKAILGLMRALENEGLAAAGVAVTSLKDAEAAAELSRLISGRRPAVILNATAFSAQRADGTTVLDAADAPVLQVIQAQSTRAAWQSSQRGLSPADLAMNVVLPELDGRLLTRIIAFKGEEARDPALEYAAVRHAPDHERMAWVARMAAAWARLGAKSRQDRRVALMLSDYPARQGRTGYAVGLDTPASVVEIAGLLADEGYDIGRAPPRHEDVEDLLRGLGDELCIPLARYRAALSDLPPNLRQEILATWGEPHSDPHCRDGAFRFTVLRAGKLLVALQPDRGTLTTRKDSYHDAALPPRHAYVALYRHLSDVERIDALVHLGTHGTLEWLPGKALALSESCWPEAVLGPLPVAYPFIVNNPGEAMQAKRRLAAVTIGHLTPPLSSAGLHGPLLDLEGLVDEYAEADGVDRRRATLLEKEIVDRAWSSGLAAECGLREGECGREAVARLDAHLCDIKDLAVRDRLHVFGRMPEPAEAEQLAESILAASDTRPHDEARKAIEDRIRDCATHERAALVAALDARRVAPGPAGAPSRGRSDVLPTGRNLTSIDPRAIPTRTAAAIGSRAADEVVRRYLQDNGDYPRSLVIDLWAAASLRTGGDDIAQALAYLGARPQWDPSSHRVTGVEIIPAARMERPRIDVTLCISGLFRDIFETQIALLDLAVAKIAELDEDDGFNPLAAARRNGRSLARIFGTAPGAYGAGTAARALDTDWRSPADLGAAYLAAIGYAYGRDENCKPAGTELRDRITSASALVHPQDDRERDILDGDGVADFAGGFAAAARMLGAEPALVHIDTSRPEAPVARSFTEEIGRIVRGRLTNPRWIAGMLSHGHRGASEIAQGVDALYAFAATTASVPSSLFDAVHEALLGDEAVVSALAERNPAALASIARRLEDALARRLWTPRRNLVAKEIERAFAAAVGSPPSGLEAAQ